MTLRETVYARCVGHVGIAALISTRCYPDRLVENVTYPAISFFLVSADNTLYRDHDGATDREVSRVQFNCFDSTGDGAAALADQVRAAWDGYSDDCDVGYAWQANRISGRADAIDIWRVIVDVIIEHSI